jgi:hypothetical protein
MKAADSVHTATTLLENNINSAMNESIPKSNYKGKIKSKWFPESLLKLYREKEKAYNKWKKTASPTDHAAYKRLTKQVKQKMLISKKEFFFNSFSGCKDVASYWRSLNQFTGRSQRDEIPMLKTGTGEAFTDDQKAEALRHQFASVFTNCSPQIDTGVSQESYVIPKADVKRMLKKIAETPLKKAMGNDGIASPVIKNCSLVIAPCLVVLADRIMNEGVFPEAWKLAIVVPVSKVRGSSNPSDYRPVSLLPLISKLVEKHINHILLQHIEPFLSDVQFGFREGRSTADAIILLQHFILRGFEKCEKEKKAAKVAVVFFDVAKAFDSVPHSTLLKHMHDKFNLPPYLTTFLTSYLAGRTMKIKVNNSLSSSSQVTSGVPQGSVLGPTLFLAYINAITEVTLSDGSQIILFADDMVMTHPLNNDEAAALIQEDIHQIAGGIETLGLRLNSSKCKFEIISLASSGNDLNIQLTLDGNQLQQVTTYRYLGVDIDDRFNFSSHTSRVVTCAKRGIGALCRSLRKWAPMEVLCKAITSIVMPAFFYAVEVWYPPNIKDQKKLERVIKYAARLTLNNFSPDAKYDELLSVINWRPLYRQVAEKRLLTIRKYMEGRRFVPDSVFPLFKEVSTRSSQRLKSQSPKHSLCLAIMKDQKNSLEDKLAAAQMRIIWNALDENTIKLKMTQFRQVIISDEVFNGLIERGVIQPVCGSI